MPGSITMLLPTRVFSESVAGGSGNFYVTGCHRHLRSRLRFPPINPPGGTPRRLVLPSPLPFGSRSALSVWGHHTHFAYSSPLPFAKSGNTIRIPGQGLRRPTMNVFMSVL